MLGLCSTFLLLRLILATEFNFHFVRIIDFFKEILCVASCFFLSLWQLQESKIAGFVRLDCFFFLITDH